MKTDKKKDISVIILTFNEEKHIRRCIERIKDIAFEIFIVDSFSSDDTVKIAESLGAIVYKKNWELNYSKQFNWALSNLPIKTEWVLRLDADEYLYPELIAEIKFKLCFLSKEITGIVFKRRHIFLEKWMKNGTYPVKLLRLFRFNKGFCEQRWMDEHIELVEGEAIEFDNDFADHNLNSLNWWLVKHIGYTVREAVDLIDIELNLSNTSDSNISKLSIQAAAKRQRKLKYARQPLFWRSFAYFIYRYFFKFGFLEGKEGFLWHFLQGWWYRTLVDAKIFEIKQACGTDTQKIKDYLLEHYQIKI